MSVSTWDPHGDSGFLEDRLDRLFREVAGPGPVEAAPQGGPWTPAVDILEDSETFVLRVDVPGLDQEEIDLRVLDGTLTLRGQRGLSADSRPGTLLRSERPRGAFVRSFALPASVDPAAIRATQKNGVLDVVLSKKKESKTKAIRIEVT